MGSFFAELKRRHVYKVGAIYLVTAWVLIQVIVTIKGPLGLPGWADTFVIILLSIGFPVALILAWAFDIPRKDSTLKEADVAAQPGSLSTKNPHGEIRFCTTADGIRLAYSVNGTGHPVVRTGNWLSHLELEWSNPIFHPLLRDLSAKYRLITYDGRGTGLSDREVQDFSLDTMVEDMEAVVDAIDLEKFSVVAYSQSCMVSVAYAVKHPERVANMVFFGGFARNFRTPEEVEAIATLFAQSWGQANPATRQIFTAAVLPDATMEEFEAFNELQRRSASPANASRLFKTIHGFDVRELAKKITVPTLVMHSRDEPGVPIEYGRELASLIPGARFISLDSRNHMLLEREPAYKRFLDETFTFINHNQVVS